MGEPAISTVHRRWGDAVRSGRIGYTAVPNILVRSRARLDLSTTESVVLFNLFLHWWEPGKRSNKTAPRHVPLGETARALLDDLADTPSGEWVFPGKNGNEPLTDGALSGSGRRRAMRPGSWQALGFMTATSTPRTRS